MGAVVTLHGEPNRNYTDYDAQFLTSACFSWRENAGRCRRLCFRLLLFFLFFSTLYKLSASKTESIAMSPSVLLSLNEDICPEILCYLLLETPREPNRISILRTCRSLLQLGLPHLYRIVDLTGYRTRNVVLRHWKTLFGEGGVLTSSNREKVGSLVRKLKLGAKAKASLTIFDSDPDTG